VLNKNSKRETMTMSNTRIFEVCGDNYTVVLDSKFDLAQAGLANSQIHCDAFEAAFRDAAEKLADELDISINIELGNYEGPAMLKQTSNGDEGELWQEIHCRLRMPRIAITIYADGVLAGQGVLTRDNEIQCDAAIGDDAYEAIADAIDNDDDECECDGVRYSWDIEAA
jgi:hypothetical protein